MFTGIIETLGRIEQIDKEGSNIHFTISSSISAELKIDQSVAHDGVCLTVVKVEGNQHTVTAIDETLIRSKLGNWKKGGQVNLERAMKSQARLDGHIVQGHVDTTGTCTAVENKDGSWIYTFKYKPNPEHLLVDKGSICINGVSLTVVSPEADLFSVAIIPYTYEHTNFNEIQVGDTINLEFDIIGKYIARHIAVYANQFNL